MFALHTSQYSQNKCCTAPSFFPGTAAHTFRVRGQLDRAFCMWSKQEIEQNSEQGVIDDVPAWCPWAWMGWLWICHHYSLFINVLIVFSWVFCVKWVSSVNVKQTQVCKSSSVINLTTLCYNEQLSDKHASVNQNELIPRRHAAQMDSEIRYWLSTACFPSLLCSVS